MPILLVITSSSWWAIWYSHWKKGHMSVLVKMTNPNEPVIGFIRVLILPRDMQSSVPAFNLSTKLINTSNDIINMQIRISENKRRGIYLTIISCWRVLCNSCWVLSKRRFELQYRVRIWYCLHAVCWFAWFKFYWNYLIVCLHRSFVMSVLVWQYKQRYCFKIN